MKALAAGAARTARIIMVVGAVLSQIYLTPYAMAADVAPGALPTGGQVVIGGADITTPTTTHMQIKTHTNRTGINWNSFDIGQESRVSIQQPDATSLTLNRVKNGVPTKIFGKLDSNGRVVVANPAGVWFGPDSHVDVAGLVAAAADIDPATIAQNEMAVDASQATAGVLADGAIVVSGQGGAALVGRSVEQRGTVTAPGGNVTMSAADSFNINLRSDGRLEVTATKAATQTAPLPDGRAPTAAVKHSGRIDASGGRVTLAADVANAALDEAINVSHHTSADKAVVVGDVIKLISSGDGTVRVKGTLVADAQSATGKGGNVRVYGKNIALEEGAKITARGGSTSGAGGTILVGGDYQGQRTAQAPKRNAERTYVAKGATMDASARGQGDGGKVVVWADKATHYSGDAAATGGATGGDGGLIEVSGYETLGFYGYANVSAPIGQQGRILLDPRDITIAAAGPDDGNIGSYIFFANPTTATDVTFSAAAIAALTGAVEIQASRNIIINSAVDFANAATTSVAFRAGQNITISAPVQASGGASLAFFANDVGSTTRLATATISVGANIGGATTGAISFSNSGGSGALNLTANTTWQTNNANVTVTMTGSQIRGDAGNNNHTLTVNAGTGDVSLGAIGTATTVPGAISITGNNVTVGNVITGTTALTRAGGSFTINAAGTAVTGSLTTVGGRIGNVGQAGGAISITGNAITVGAQNTTGNAAAGAASNGGAGGAIVLNSGTTITMAGVTTTGGAATTTGTAGAGGNVTLTAPGGITNSAGLTMNGGATANAAGVNGAGGTFTVNNNFLHTQNANNTINTAGGIFAGAADGLGGTQTYSGTFTFTPGTARTLTMQANTGAINFSNNAVTFNNGSTVTITADAFNLPDAVASFSTTGSVAIQPYTPTLTKGIGSTAAGDWIFTQTDINAINSNINTLTIGSATGTGLMTVSGTAAFNSDNITLRNQGTNGSILFAATADLDMATSGNRTLTLAAGGGTGNITLNAGAFITNNSGATGNTVFQTNSLVLNGASGAVTGNGVVIFQGAAAGTTVGFAGGAGTAQFTQAHFDAMPSFIHLVLGNSAGTGLVTVGGAMTNGGRQLTIRSMGAGGAVTFTNAAAVSMTGANRTLTIATGTNATDAVTFQNGATITNNTGATGNITIQANTMNSGAAAGAISGNGTLTVQTIGAANTMGIGTGAGQLSLTQTALDQFGGFVSQAFGRAHTNTVNVNGAVDFVRTTTITSNGAGGSIALGSTADVNLVGATLGFTLNTGSGVTYAANINSLVMAPGARITNNTGGNISIVANNVVAGDADAITGAAVVSLQQQADGVTGVIGTGAGQAVYGQDDLDMFNGFTSQVFGRAAGTVQLGVGGNIVFERTTTLRASGANGSIRFYDNADVQVTGTNTTLNINTGTGTTYAADINTWAMNAGATLTNNSGAAGAIVYTGNNLNFNATSSVTGNGIITLQPTATGTTLGVGVGATGAAQYSADSIARITAFSQLNIGRTDATVAMGINGALALNMNTAFRMMGGNGAINIESAAAITTGGTDTVISFTTGSGTGGTAAQNIFTMAATSSITNNSGANSQINIDTNKITVNAGAVLTGDGILTIQPRSTAQTVGVGTGAGGLSVNNAVLGAISGFSEQRFGNAASTVLMTVDGAPAFNLNTLLRAGGASGDITFAATAAATVSGGNNLTILVGTGTGGTFTFTNGATLGMGTGTLTINANTIALGGTGNISGTGQLIVQQVEDNISMGIAGGAGQLALTTAHLNAFAGFDSQTFGRASSTAAIIVNGVTFARDTILRGNTSTLTTAGAIDLTVAGEGLTIDTSGLITLGNNITTNGGDISIGTGLIVLSGNIAISSSDGDIAFGNTVNSTGGARNLTVNAGAGTLTFAGALGDSATLADVSLTAEAVALPAVTASGDLAVTATDGDVTQTGILTIGDDLTVTAQGIGRDIVLTLNNLITDTIALLTDATTGGDIILTSAGADTRLAAISAGNDITINSTNDITLTANVTSTGGDIALNNNTLLAADVVIDSGDGAVVFAGTVDSSGGVRDLTVDAGTGGITFGGAVGGNSALDSMALVAGAALALPAITAQGDVAVTTTAGNVTQTGALDVDGALTVTANTAAGQSIALGGANNITGLVSLLTNAATGGAITFNNTGATQFDAASTGGDITITSGGLLTLNGGLTSTTGDVVVNGNMELADDITIAAGDDINLNGTINSDGTARDLTVNASSGTITLGGALGGSAALDNVSFTSATGLALRAIRALGDVDVAVAAGNVTQTGALDIDGALTVTANTVAGQNITLTNVANAINGLVNLLANATTGGNIAFTNSVASQIGAASTGGNITIASAAGMTLNDDLTSNSGDITLTGPVVLADNIALTAGDDIILSSTVNSDGAARNLTVDASAGSITFGGALGGLDPLGNVALTTATALALPAITATGDLSVTAGSGIISQAGALNIGGDALFDADNAIGQDIVLSNNSNLIAGTARFRTDAATGGAVIYNTAGNIALGDSISGDNMTITSVAGDITQTAGSTIDVAGDLGLLATTGTFTQGAGATFIANGLGMDLDAAATLNNGNTFGRIAANYRGAGEDFSLTRGSAITVDAVAGVVGITADTVFLRTTAGDIRLEQDVVATGAGNAVVLASAAGFVNNAGVNGIQPGTGRYIIYSNQPGSPDTVLGGLTPNKQYNRTYAGYGPGAVVETGNRIFYSIAPTLTLTAVDTQRAAGDPNPVFTYTISNTFIDGDGAGTALAGAPTITTTAGPASPEGFYPIDISQGGLSSPLRYTLVFVDGILTVGAPVVNPTPTQPAFAGLQNVIPAMINTHQPSRVLEVAASLGLEEAIEEDGRVIGRLPVGLILPTGEEGDDGENQQQDENEEWAILPSRSGRVEY